jgi:hypothetical protein
MPPAEAIAFMPFNLHCISFNTTSCHERIWLLPMKQAGHVSKLVGP